MPKWNTAVPVLAVLMMTPAAFTPAALADGVERHARPAPAPLKAPGHAYGTQTYTPSTYVPQGTISGPDYRQVTSGGYSGYSSQSGGSYSQTTTSTGSGYSSSGYSGHGVTQYGAQGGASVGSADTKSIMTCATGRSSPADAYVECGNWVISDRVVYREDFPVTYSQSPQPAPVYSAPAPVYSAPAPVYHAPAPVVYAPAPAPVRTTSTATLSDGFFSGMAGGVGRDIATGAFYGGGGTVISSSASSSVAARSPVAIVINAKRRGGGGGGGGGGGHKPTPPAHPPKGGCGGCGH